MKVAHLSTVHIRSDTRLFYKEVTSVAREFETILIVADGDGDQVIDDIPVFDLGKPKSRMSRIFKKGIQAYKACRHHEVNLVHFHDPELVVVGFFLSLKGVKVVYDIHELIYDDIKTKKWLKPKWFRALLSEVYQLMESFFVRSFDLMIIAEDGYRPHYSKRYSKLFDKKFIAVRNFPKKELLLKSDVIPEVPSGKKNNLIYLGAVSKDRGIVEMVDMMQYLDDSFHLNILGTWHDKELLSTCEQSPGWKKVTYVGYVKPDKIGEYISQSKLGLCILHKIENFAYTNPVKSFEYLINKVPLVMTDFEYWKEFYEGTAIFVDPENVKDIAIQIKTLCPDKERLDKMASQGYDLALVNNWDSEEKRLLAAYKNLSLCVE